MRRQFLQVVDRRTAWRHAPWASRITKVEGGFMAFESIADFCLWRRTK